MPLVKRRFYIPCNHNECLEIVQRISEKLPSIESIEYEIKEGGMFIEMYGYSTDIKRAWRIIRENYPLSKNRVGRGMVKYSLKTLVQHAGKTFPPAVLVKVLSINGYKVQYFSTDETLHTNAGLDVLLELINQIEAVANSVRNIVKGTAGKYYLTTISVATKMSVEEVVEKALALGHLDTGEDGVLTLKIEWSKGVDEFIKKYHGSSLLSM